MKLAADIKDIFGTVNPPAGTPGGGDPIAGIGKVFSVAIQFVLILAAVLVLVQLVVAAIEWIVSSGEKEKLLKAQNKIMNAVVGLLFIFVAFTVFSVIVNVVLGGKIIQCTPDGCSFDLPQLK
ncbi:hypothetical protein M1523_02655 [Patescibacteria group bacterium]|nr:hypothetical protein [Patescibacteria group bacterium]MCL5091378.1 hypothetical protein [Patescibacteria group bacterium]